MLEVTGDRAPATALQQKKVSPVKVNDRGWRGPNRGFSKQPRLLHLYLALSLPFFPIL